MSNNKAIVSTHKAILIFAFIDILAMVLGFVLYEHRPLVFPVVIGLIAVTVLFYRRYLSVDYDKWNKTERHRVIAPWLQYYISINSMVVSCYYSFFNGFICYGDISNFFNVELVFAISLFLTSYIQIAGLRKYDAPYYIVVTSMLFGIVSYVAACINLDFKLMVMYIQIFTQLFEFFFLNLIFRDTEQPFIPNIFLICEEWERRRELKRRQIGTGGNNRTLYYGFIIYSNIGVIVIGTVYFIFYMIRQNYDLHI